MTRTRTAPAVKWVANEVAAVRGEIERIDESMARLAQRRSKLQGDLTALEHVAAQLTVVPATAKPLIVRAHGRYGERGALRNWLRLALQQAHPRALDSVSLTAQAIDVFSLQFSSAQERHRFSTNNLGSALRRLADAGEVERVHDPSRPYNRVGAWRWKVPDDSLEALRDLCSRS